MEYSTLTGGLWLLARTRKAVFIVVILSLVFSIINPHLLLAESPTTTLDSLGNISLSDAVIGGPGDSTSTPPFDAPVIHNFSSIITPSPCVSGLGYADQVVASLQGTQKDGSPVIAARSHASATLGAPDGNFYSLGLGGTVTVGFTGKVINVPGNDLSFHEITLGRDAYPEERASVEVSQDNVNFFGAGIVSSKTASGVDYIDFNSTGLSWIKYVRITDQTNFAPMTDNADGYDLDAVDATTISCASADLKKSGVYSEADGTITYSLNWNVTGSGSTHLIITDPLPVGTTFVSADNGGILTAGVVTWDLGIKNSGDSGTVILVVSVDAANPYATQVIATMQGTNKNGTPVAADRSDPSKALGPPQSTGTPYDNDPSLMGTFYSLGFNLQGDGGWLTVKFNSDVVDKAGPDLKVFETTFGSSYPDESVKVEASNNTSTWTSLGTVTRDGTVDLSTGGLTSAKYVRVTDTSFKPPFEPTADAYDLDAIQALHRNVPLCSIKNTATVSWSVSETTMSTDASTTTIVNEDSCKPQIPPVTIQAMKVVCLSESDLPNWGGAGVAKSGKPSDIASTTATDFVIASQGRCHLAPDWHFQWGYGEKNNQSGVNMSTGDWVGESSSSTNTLGMCDPESCGVNTATGPGYNQWKDFDSSTVASGTIPAMVSVADLNGASKLWVREDLKNGYVPFSGPGPGFPPGSDLSAEIYCHNDIHNYDNFDYIAYPAAGQTYYCVAFNASKVSDNNGGGGSSTSTVADLAVVKSVNLSTTTLSSNLIYTISFKNNGPGTGTSVSVLDALPATLAFVSATSTIGDYSTTTNSWALGTVASGTTATLTIVASVVSGSTIVNTAQITASSTDSNLANNISTVTTTIIGNGNPGGGCLTDCVITNSIISNGGGGGGGGNTPPSFTPQILGASTTTDGSIINDSSNNSSIPAIPEILGATTELPRTGMSWYWLIALLLLGTAIAPKYKEIKFKR